MKLRLPGPRFRRLALLTAFVLVAASGWILRPGVIRALRGEPRPEEALIEGVLGIIRQHYADSLDERDLRLRAVEGILRSLPDRYSTLLVDDQLKSYQDLLEGTSGDVGVGFVDGPLGLTVAEVTPGSPAATRGVQPGDRVLAIEDAPTDDWSAFRGEQALRGEPGSSVRIALRHPGSPAVAGVVLRRERLRVVGPGLRILGPAVGYIRLGSLSRGSARTVQAAVTRMTGEGARAVVLDLRNNPGGLVEEATALLDLFLDQGARIGTVQGRSLDRVRRFVSGGRQRWPGLKVVVLVNAATASAAEIIAAGLKENRRATVVGEHTVGKGLVQSTIALAPNLAVRLSTAHWLTPAGRALNGPGGAGGGVEPDLVVLPWKATRGDSALRALIGARGDAVRLVLERMIARKEWQGTAADSDTAAIPRPVLRRLAVRLAAAGVSLSPQQLARGSGLLRQEYVVVAATQGVLSARARRPELPDAQLNAAVRLLEGEVAGSGAGMR
jgi:carboxyl-terminal processing protease